MCAMDLHSYLSNLPPDGRDDFAVKCDTTQNYLWKLARGFKSGLRPKPRLASLIERASNQMVRRWESNPEDWWETWPELINSEGAPEVPVRIEQEA